MAKALIGYMHSDPRTPARLAAENARLRARVAELEALDRSASRRRTTRCRGRAADAAARAVESGPAARLTRVTRRTDPVVDAGMRALSSLAAAGLLLTSVGAAAPAFAHGDAERNREVRTQLLAEERHPAPQRQRRAPRRPTPAPPGSPAASPQTAPLFVTSGLESVTVWDVSDATNPTRVGRAAQRGLRERGDELRRAPDRRRQTRRFALIGVDLVDAAVDRARHSAHQRRRRRAGRRRGHRPGRARDRRQRRRRPPAPTPSPASTTPTAATPTPPATAARHLLDLRPPQARASRARSTATRTRTGVQPFRSPTGGHKWNFDNAGIGTHTGFDGSSMWDVDRPRHPRLLATTGGPAARATPAVPTATTTSSTTTPSGPTPARSRPDAAPVAAPTATCCW